MKHELIICEIQSHKRLHPYEIERDNYERELWFDGKGCNLDDFAKTVYVKNINDGLPLLTREAICFGTSIIRELGRHRIFNLHGGDPQQYRGLDTNMWAVWHRDWNSICVCLHKINKVLDGGDIFSVKKIPIKKHMKLYQLRAATTQTCIDICKEVNFDYLGWKQEKNGRYYSAMPDELKTVCVKRFEKYTASLP